MPRSYLKLLFTAGSIASLVACSTLAGPTGTEIQAAEFRLDAESVILRNAEDPRDVSVFDESWRGRTDRVVWKFVKPR